MLQPSFPYVCVTAPRRAMQEVSGLGQGYQTMLMHRQKRLPKNNFGYYRQLFAYLACREG